MLGHSDSPTHCVWTARVRPNPFRQTYWPINSFFGNNIMCYRFWSGQHICVINWVIRPTTGVSTNASSPCLSFHGEYNNVIPSCRSNALRLSTRRSLLWSGLGSRLHLSLACLNILSCALMICYSATNTFKLNGLLQRAGPNIPLLFVFSPLSS